MTAPLKQVPRPLPETLLDVAAQIPFPARAAADLVERSLPANVDGVMAGLGALVAIGLVAKRLRDELHEAQQLTRVGA